MIYCYCNTFVQSVSALFVQSKGLIFTSYVQPSQVQVRSGQVKILKGMMIGSGIEIRFRDFYFVHN